MEMSSSSISLELSAASLCYAQACLSRTLVLRREKQRGVPRKVLPCADIEPEENHVVMIQGGFAAPEDRLYARIGPDIVVARGSADHER